MIKDPERIRDLFEQIRNARQEDCTVLQFYKQYECDLALYEPVQVIQSLIGCYPGFATSFLLATPWLWGGFTSNDWLAVIEYPSRELQLPVNIESMYGIPDILFLCKYVNVDALSVVANCKSISSEKRRGMLRIARSLRILLVPDDESQFELDGVNFVSRVDLEAHQQKLNNEGIFRAVQFDEVTIQELTLQLLEDCLS